MSDTFDIDIGEEIVSKTSDKNYRLELQSVAVEFSKLYVYMCYMC